MNPLKGFMGQQNSPIGNIMQMLGGGMNPQALASQLLNNDPKARQFMAQMQNMSNGRSPRDMAIQYARQQGIKEKDLMELAHRMGLK